MPGRYVPLQIEIDAPGDIHIRGEGVQGIDLSAAGRGRVTVPLMVWRETAGKLLLTVNGQAQSLDARAVGMGTSDEVPDMLKSYWEAMDGRVDSMSAAINDSAYERLDLWKPGTSAAVRQFLLRAAIVVGLLLGAAMYVRTRISLPVVAITAIGAMVIVIWQLPSDVARKTMRAGKGFSASAAEDSTTNAADQRYWIWRAGRDGEPTIEEPFGRSLWFIPRSAEQLERVKPVLVADARGNPLAIHLTLSANERAAFLVKASKPDD